MFFKLMFLVLNCRNSLHILDSNLIGYKMGKAQKVLKASFTNFYITEHSNFKLFPRVGKQCYSGSHFIRVVSVRSKLADTGKQNQWEIHTYSETYCKELT